jgi:hypothetical protein
MTLVSRPDLERLDFERVDAGWGGSIDRTQLDGLATLTRAYVRQMHRIPPRTLLPQVRGHRAALRRLIQLAQPSALKRDLLVAAAETAAVDAKLSFSLGNYGDALEAYAEAERLTIEAGHSALRAYVLGQASHLNSSFWHAGPGSPVALGLLDAAIASAGVGCPALLATWLAVRRAEEHAATGNSLAADRDLDEARRRLSQRQSRPDDSGLFAHWESAPQARLDGYQGNCEQVLHRAQRAISIIEGAIAEVDPSLVGVRTSMMTDLASAHAKHGEVDHACALLVEAHISATGAGLLPHLQRLQGVRRELRRWSDTPAVKRLDERLGESWSGM